MEGDSPDKLLDSFFKDYDSGKGLGDQAAGANKKYRAELRDALDLTGDQAGCLVCLEGLQRTQAVWSCAECRETFHLQCIQQWAQHNALPVLTDNHVQDGHGGQGEHKLGNIQSQWCCPKCRRGYSPAERPSQYTCFCGQVRNPENSPWLAAHCCDNICHRTLPSCEHTCRLKCHPGKCPPCPITVNISCVCGRSSRVGRRCGQRVWSCQQVCGLLLECAKHKCTAVCHKPGECPPCTERSVRACACGKETSEQPCQPAIWHCQNICDKTLPCETHNCLKLCHSGSCGPCAVAGESRCACGAVTYDGSITCISQLPCCGGTCDKLLPCGLHNCYQQCHKGECPPCLQPVVRACACGAKQLQQPCSQPISCELKCRKLRTCGRHKCNKRCCNQNCAPCEQTCGRSLNCGRHKCASPCHPGQCYPCTEMAQVSCACGSRVLRVPCGAAKRTATPKCNALCNTPPDCHHPNRTPHKCHFGQCPPCTQRCAQSLVCGHECNAECHSAVLVDVNQTNPQPKHKTKQPLVSNFWDKKEAKYEVVSLPCPPCTTPVSIVCLGEHEHQSMACSEQRPFNCGRQCARMLPCNNHKCTRICHKCADSTNNASVAPSECEPCENLCSLPRACKHPCALPCHAAPCKPCKQAVKMNCHCQVNELIIICSKWTGSDSASQEQLLACGNQCAKVMGCGHQCTLLCHPGDCSPSTLCTKRVHLYCPCKRMHKKTMCNKRLEEALECDEQCAAELKAKQAVLDAEAKPAQITPTDSQELASGPRRNRKKRRTVDEEDDQDNNWMKKVVGLSVIGCVVSALAAYWLMAL